MLVMSIFVWAEQQAKLAIQARKAGEYKQSGVELGKLLHTIQDSYSRSHVSRDSSGQVTMFQDYTVQSGKKHGGADKDFGSLEFNLALVASQEMVNAVLCKTDENRASASLISLIIGDIYSGWLSAKAEGAPDEYKMDPKSI